MERLDMERAMVVIVLLLVGVAAVDDTAPTADRGQPSVGVRDHACLVEGTPVAAFADKTLAGFVLVHGDHESLHDSGDPLWRKFTPDVGGVLTHESQHATRIGIGEVGLRSD